MSEYNELVEKLANEIISEAVESMEKEAGIKDKASKAYGKVKSVGMKIPGMKQMTEGYGEARRLGKHVGKAEEGVRREGLQEVVSEHMKAGHKGAAKLSGIGLGAGGLGAGGVLGTKALMKKKKEASAEKAAEILFEAQLQKIAAEEAFEEAQLSEDASVRILEELGIDPDELIQAMIEAEETEE